MHIVLLAPDLRGKSGWSRAALDLAHGLQERGHRVTAIVAESSQSGIEEYVGLWPATKLLSNPLVCIWNAWKLRPLLATLKPDILHAIAEPYAMVLGLLPTSNATTFVTVHGSYAAIPFHGNALTRMLMTRALARIDRIITVSHFTKGYLLDHAGPFVGREVLESKIHVIPNAIDLHRFPHELSQNGPHTPPHILSVGAIKPRKGLLQAIETCAILRQEGMSFHYDIVGSLDELPPYVADLRKMIEQNGLSSHVTLHGVVSEEDLQKIFARSDVFLMPSRHGGLHVEGFGIVFLEANAWGLPVVGPNTGGCPEVIRD